MSQTPIACTKAFAEPPPIPSRRHAQVCRVLHRHMHKQLTDPNTHIVMSIITSGSQAVPFTQAKILPDFCLTSQNQPLADTCMQWTTDLLGTGHKISHAQLPGSQALPALTQRDTLVHRYTSQGHRPRTHCTLYTEATTGTDKPPISKISSPSLSGSDKAATWSPLDPQIGHVCSIMLGPVSAF